MKQKLFARRERCLVTIGRMWQSTAEQPEQRKITTPVTATTAKVDSTQQNGKQDVKENTRSLNTKIKVIYILQLCNNNNFVTTKPLTVSFA